MWFFERDIALNLNADNVHANKVHAKRQPNIYEGNYCLRSCYDTTVYMNFINSSPPRIAPGSTTTKVVYYYFTSVFRCSSCNSSDMTVYTKVHGKQSPANPLMRRNLFHV